VTFGRGACAILVKPSTIQGLITSSPLEPAPAGDPVEGVVVVLDAGGSPPEHLLTALTDSRGHYRFVEIPPGTYSVRLKAPPGYIRSGDELERIAVNGSSVHNLDFRYRFSTELAQAKAP
jgi:hypothetical protein